MRALHVIPSVSERSGGPATAIIPMCRALQGQGIDVTLVSTNDGLRRINTDRAEDYKGVAARFFPVEFGASFKYSRALATWLKANVKTFDVVHVHAVFNHASIVAASACRKAGVPYVVRPLGTLDPWSMKQKPLRKRIFWTLKAKSILQRAAAVHYTTRVEKEATEAHLGVNHGQVIPLGVVVNDANHADQTAAQPYVLTLSRLHPKKALDVLIDAFLALNKDPWRLVIAGDGPADYVSFLKQKARNSEKITFAGWVEGEQKDALFRNASLFALPSRQENFGLSVLEAMARGVPALVSSHVNLAGDIEAAAAGWVVELDQLGHGLDAAMTDEDERSQRGRAAHLFSQQFSWERIATELSMLYRDILSQS
jgi:glycosyltransferase involved in cell wall biosynthesis